MGAVILAGPLGSYHMLQDGGHASLGMQLVRVIKSLKDPSVQVSFPHPGPAFLGQFLHF